MKISIPEPCPEKWGGMTPNKEGAFCSVCVKTVVDFTGKTTNEIRSFFTNRPGSERVCGRFKHEQLSELSFEDFYARFRFWNFTKKCAAIILFVFSGIFFSSCGPATGEVIEEPMGKTAVQHDTLSAKDTTEIATMGEPMVVDTAKNR